MKVGKEAKPEAQNPVDLLIFDCDGVLVDSEIIAHRILEEQLTQGLPGMDVVPLVANTAGMSTQAVLERVASTTGRT
ncbi:MAG: HAD family phosphatase, partial [Candidatus Competibacteraceae bacterium]|nr:HAD family phosphatase [Candidatus Competibacteraceae bacterium]